MKTSPAGHETTALAELPEGPHCRNEAQVGSQGLATAPPAGAEEPQAAATQAGVAEVQFPEGAGVGAGVVVAGGCVVAGGVVVAGGGFVVAGGVVVAGGGCVVAGGVVVAGGGCVVAGGTVVAGGIVVAGGVVVGLGVGELGHA